MYQQITGRTDRTERIEIDAESYQVLYTMAQKTGKTIPDLFRALAVKYRQANTLERQIVINFLRGL